MKELLTVQILASLLRKSRRAVYADIARGKFPLVRIGRRVFFRADAIERFLAAREVPALPESLDPATGRGGAA